MTDSLKATAQELRIKTDTLQNGEPANTVQELRIETDTLQNREPANTAQDLRIETDTLQNREPAKEQQATAWELQARADSITGQTIKTLPAMVDTTLTNNKVAEDWSTWRPDPQKALWLALVIPGGGQIYNRKYWKLPIVYGGFIGCMYAMSWNNMMYRDYAQAYLDLMDKDPGTQSYNQFLHLGAKITKDNEDRYKEIFKKRKDRYRRWRDLSFFVMVGVYALSVIDAYVDAELSVFDISDDLSLRVEPTVINNHGSSNPIEGSSLGLHCSLNF